MNPSKQIGDVLGLGRLRLIHPHADVPRRPVGHRLAMGLHCPGIHAGKGIARYDASRDVCDLGAIAPGPAQGDRCARRQGEFLLEPQDAVSVRPPEAVDGLIRIAHRDHLRPEGRQLAQKGHLGRVGVLVLVDEDGAQPSDILRRIVAHQGRRTPDE